MISARGAITQFLQQRPGVFEIGGVEALGEPVVDVGEHRARIVAAVGTHQHSRERGGRAQFERFRPLLSGLLDRVLDRRSRQSRIGRTLTQEQLAAKTINFRFPETFAAATDEVQGVADRLQTMFDASGSQARLGKSRETEREPQLLSAGRKCIGFFAYLPYPLLRSSKLG